LEQQDYARHVEGLNTYRTYTLPREVQFAEAYRCIQWADLGAETGRPSSNGAEDVLAVADAQAEGLLQHIMDLQRTQQEASVQLESLTRQAQQLSQQNEEHVQALNNVLSSHSWRMTQPLRWAASHIRRLIG
jgi:cell division septum initiation protein DivIVA